MSLRPTPFTTEKYNEAPELRTCGSDSAKWSSLGILPKAHSKFNSSSLAAVLQNAQDLGRNYSRL